MYEPLTFYFHQFFSNISGPLLMRSEKCNFLSVKNVQRSLKNMYIPPKNDHLLPIYSVIFVGRDIQTFIEALQM